MGANCIYPILGVAEYGWRFVGSDVDPVAMEHAKEIVHKNLLLRDMVDLRWQADPQRIFSGILKNDGQFSFSMCNPPFHSSAEEASKATARKWSNLRKKAILPIPSSKRSNLTNGRPLNLNFGGQSGELYCPGGELTFIRQMIKESAKTMVRERIGWFTSLVSKVPPRTTYFTSHPSPYLPTRSRISPFCCSPYLKWTRSQMCAQSACLMETKRVAFSPGLFVESQRLLAIPLPFSHLFILPISLIPTRTFSCHSIHSSARQTEISRKRSRTEKFSGCKLNLNLNLNLKKMHKSRKRCSQSHTIAKTFSAYAYDVSGILHPTPTLFASTFFVRNNMNKQRPVVFSEHLSI